MKYQIITDATADFCQEMVMDFNEIQIIPMQVHIGEETYEYGSVNGLTPREFYEKQTQGLSTGTSQINPYTYKQVFEKVLKDGIDILYLGFSSGMSGSMSNALLCAETLNVEYPERKIICIDTLCASAGEGLLVVEAAKKQTQGMELEELAEWLLKYRLNMCHWFTVDSLEYLRRGGRISSTAAAVGTVLNIKPVLHVDTAGKLDVSAKGRGWKQAMKIQIEHMKKSWNPQIGQTVLIGNANDPKRAEELKKCIQTEFPNAEIDICPIGPVIGTHTGPGMILLAFWGNER